MNTMLNQRISGDAQDGSSPASYRDLIICREVLEHLSKPELALKNFVKSTNDEGIILLASPNVLTVRGLLTEFTPHWVHVWYYLNTVGSREAGTPGNFPSKSYHRFARAPSAPKKLAHEHNVNVELSKYASWDHPEHRYEWFTLPGNPVNKVINLLTFVKGSK